MNFNVLIKNLLHSKMALKSRKVRHALLIVSRRSAMVPVHLPPRRWIFQSTFLKLAKVTLATDNNNKLLASPSTIHPIQRHQLSATLSLQPTRDYSGTKSLLSRIIPVISSRLWHIASRHFSNYSSCTKDPFISAVAISKLDTLSTIYALSSGHGVCGVAVIRVSGPGAGPALAALGRFRHLPKPRSAILRTLRHPHTGEALDQAIVIWFPGPRSFTGEDSCELHVHGGTAVVTGVLEALGVLPGLKPAAPGDFTKRAFSHGRLDLTEVEGLADLIHAETEAQRRQALQQMEGSLSRLYLGWRARLVKCVANVSAFIDFSEDELIEDEVINEVTESVRCLRAELELHLKDGRRGERLRGGVHVAIIGEPNVGKSSILNALCGRPAAIVSATAGTTRDVVESAVNLAGYPVLLSDTAGLRDAADGVEREGVRRARDRAVDADIRLIVIDPRKLLPPPGDKVTVLLETYIARHLADLGFITSLAVPDSLNNSRLGTAETASTDELSYNKTDSAVLLSADPTAHPAASIIIVFNKCDLVDADTIRDVIATNDASLRWACLSCVTMEGMSDVMDELTAKVKQMCGNPSSQNPSLTQSRHRHHIEACLGCLESFLQEQNVDLVLAGEHLRRAIYQMGKLTGKITSEEILDVVFRDFCIGK